MFRYLFLLIFLLPSVHAWTWQTHEEFSTALYYTLDETTQNTLDLAQLQVGSITPDKTFKDFRRHSYPSSVGETNYWLAQTQEAYAEENYSYASYALGIASHYIVDSFSAPHNIGGESSYLHSSYEKQATLQDIEIICLNVTYDLNNLLAGGTQNGEDWERWVSKKEPSLVKQHVQEAFTMLLFISTHILETTCQIPQREHKTVENSFPTLGLGTIAILGLLSGVFILTVCSLRQER